MRGNITHQQRHHKNNNNVVVSGGVDRNIVRKAGTTAATAATVRVVGPGVVGSSKNGTSNANYSNINNNNPRVVSGHTSSKITIKPFAKPPKLPDNYYEETASTILQGTLQFLEQRQLAAGSSASSSSGGVGATVAPSRTATPNSKSSTNSTNQTTTTTTNNNPHNYSLQSAYSSTVHLVSHQFGGRLYGDLVRTFEIAAERVLLLQPDGTSSSPATAAAINNATNSSSNNNNNNNNIMQYIVDQYTIYTDYLLLCKHILTPLDRTWQWQDSLQKAIPIATTTSSSSSSSGATGTSSYGNKETTTTSNKTTTSSSTTYHHSLQTIWQVGLTCFLRRLQYLKLDVLLYQQWLQAFLQDWNGSMLLSSSSSPSCVGNSPEQRYTLQQVWYLWQDLGLLSQLTIQYDLEQYWYRVSMEYAANTAANSGSITTSSTNISSSTSSSSSSAVVTQFIQFCYEKHIHCYNYRQWLPVPWLWNILDIHLFQQHLITNTNNTNTNTNTANTLDSSSTPLVLRDENLHPILQEAVFQQLQQEQQQQQLQQKTSRLLSNNTSDNVGTSTSSGGGIGKWSTVQILWMLAGRIHGGQRVLTTAIQRFARIQGLQRVQQQSSSSNSSIANTTVPSTASTTAATSPAAPSTAAVQDLLQLQDCLSAMIQTLPMTTGGSSGGGGLILLPNAPLPPSAFIGHSNINSIISLKSVWEEVVNVDTEPSIAEQLAKFLDSILKNNKKIDMYQNQQTAIITRNNNSTMSAGGGASEAAAAAAAVAASGGSSNAWLTRIVMGIFVPLSSKDIFEAFYKKDLAKRLLLGRVVSMDIEKQVCSLLKAECGAGYTSKMEGMFQDIEWSRETMMIYKAHSMTYSFNNSNNISEKKDKPVEMEAQVLTTGYWPVYPQYPMLQLPDNLKEPQNQFADYYKTKYQGRRMTWQYYLGNCHVKAIGFNKPYELVVSLCQALTLLQFTTKDNSLGPDGSGGWTIQELQRAVGIDSRDDMERILQSLALGKEGTKILRKIDYETFQTSTTSAPIEQGNNVSVSGGNTTVAEKQPAKQQKKSPMNSKKTRRDVDDRDKFIINTDFESNQHRIKINNILFKETKEEHDKTVEGISRDRLYLIDAVLVRIMKARKTILHQQLIPQVLEQIKVPALPADIKKRIESLIEREYMERDAKDRNRYNYLA